MESQDDEVREGHVWRRLTRLEQTVGYLEDQMPRLHAAMQSMHAQLAQGLHELVEQHGKALTQFQEMLAAQDERWREAHKELTESAIALMQEAMLKALAGKMLDWLWTLIFSAALVGLGYVATKLGLH